MSRALREQLLALVTARGVAEKRDAMLAGEGH